MPGDRSKGPVAVPAEHHLHDDEHMRKDWLLPRKLIRSTAVQGLSGGPFPFDLNAWERGRARLRLR